MWVWCEACERWFPAEGEDGYFPHVVRVHPESLTTRAIGRALGDIAVPPGSSRLTVHYVAGIGVTPRHWAQREPAPHHEPAV